MARLPIPNVPIISDPKAQKWMYDVTKTLESFFRSTPEQTTFEIVPYSLTGNLKGVVGVPIIVPDHPSGYSIIIWDGTVFQRFTSVGVL